VYLRLLAAAINYSIYAGYLLSVSQSRFFHRCVVAAARCYSRVSLSNSSCTNKKISLREYKAQVARNSSLVSFNVARLRNYNSNSVAQSIEHRARAARKSIPSVADRSCEPLAVNAGSLNLQWPAVKGLMKPDARLQCYLTEPREFQPPKNAMMIRLGRLGRFDSHRPIDILEAIFYKLNHVCVSQLKN